VKDGGTGRGTFDVGTILIGDGTNNIKQLANVSAINTSIASNNTVNNLTTDVYGRVTGYTTQAISGLTVGQGGTGVSTFTSGQLVVGAGTGALQGLANSTYTLTGGLSSSNTITSVTVDAYGRVTAVTGASIAISALQITSGTLPVARGGTGATTFTTNGITYGNGTGAIQSTVAAGTSDQTWSNQILTVTNAGVPVWTTSLDGGSF
jgi:hypothetical protein